MTASKSAPVTPVEVHFTEGFFEDDIRVVCEGTELTRLALTTRMQTGLAEIATLKLTTGKEVTLECTERALRTTITVDAATPFVTVALRDGAFDISASDHSPGYL